MSFYGALFLLSAALFILLVLIEACAYFYLKNNGISSNFLIAKTKKNHLRDNRFSVIDPHLGYSRDESSKPIQKFKKRFLWENGFAIYESKRSEIKPFVILTLGGSTTDAVYSDHSWPEYLSGMLKSKGINATVINGGMGGYSTNQELLKLIRDGFEFKPDIVISYSGINDRGEYSELPYPMVHKFQRQTLESIINKNQPKILPSTISLIYNFLPKPSLNITYTFGVKSNHNLGQQYLKNIKMMHTLCQAENIKFIGFIQPFKFYKNKNREAALTAERQKYAEHVNALYEQIMPFIFKYDYLHDATNILADQNDAYETDGTHLKAQGDKMVAQYIFNAIQKHLDKSTVRINN